MIDLPAYPGPNACTPRLLDFGGFLEPGLGGETQRLNRQGNRYGVAITLPPLESAREGRIWVSRLIRGKSEGARIDYPLLDFDPGVPGAFLVDGAGQSGRVLHLRGGTPHYAFKEGQPFSLEIAGQHFLYFLDQQAIADGAGSAAIQFSPMLRKQPPDGAALHLSKPMIEGYIMGDELSWQLAVDRTIGLSFEIHERR